MRFYFFCNFFLLLLANIDRDDFKQNFPKILQQTGGKYVNTWHKEYLQMQDSLRVDSFYKEGYKAGQQSIRDSLAQAQTADSNK